MTRLATAFSRRLGLGVPLIVAPMAGGPTSPQLVAATSAAGALGSFGFAYTQPEDMKRQAAWVREKTAAPFGINLFSSALPAPIDAAAQRSALDAVAPLLAELGVPVPEPVRAPYAPDVEAQLAAVEEIRPAVLTAHLGDFPVEIIRKLRQQGIVIGGSATCIEEAKRLESLGCDFVIAQGGEAGGHRGTYLRNPYDALTGTLALTRMLVRAIGLPVVAAGGIMDGAGIAAALALGAQAAQLGTAFIPCPESGASTIHKQSLLRAEEDTTQLTEKFSGKPARGLVNRFMKEMAGKPHIAFPAQNMVTGKLRQASAQAGKPDFVAMWAGQAAPLSREMPAAELVAVLEREAIEALQAAASLVQP
jgi:nitronate monooxygenase